MFKNGMLVADYKNELMSRYGYREELAEDIAMAAESIVNYLGNEYEDVVLAAIANTKVVTVEGLRDNGIKETVSDVLKREGMSDGLDGKTVSDKDIRNIEGIYCEEPQLTYTEKGYEMVAVKKVAVINSSHEPGNVYFLGKLIGELLKGVKAHLLEYSIEEDKLVVRSGLSEEVSKLSHRGSIVRRKVVERHGYGLEEGMNAYDQLSIMRDDYYSKYELPKHNSAVLAAGVLADGLNLKDTIHEAQVTKDMRILEEICNAHTSCGFESLLTNFDTLHDLENSRNAAIGTEEFDAISSELDEHFVSVIAPSVKEMKVSMKLVSSEDMNLSEGNTL